MLVREPSWLKLLFRLRGSEWRRLGPRLLTFTVFGVAVTAAFKVELLETYISVVPFTLVGLPLGIFLGFRANRAHDRYWEARTLWGNLVNATRSLSRQVCHLIAPVRAEEQPEVTALQREVVTRVVGFCYGLRAHLSEQPVLPEIEPHVPGVAAELESERNLPQALARSITPRLAAARQRDWLHAMHLPDLEMGVTRMTDVQGACERIKQTPLPVAYAGLTHRLVAMYCLGLPFGLVEPLGWVTPAVVFFIGYAFLGLEGIAEEIEMPFATGPNQLPLLTICRTIDLNLHQTLGETQDLPELPRVENGILP